MNTYHYFQSYHDYFWQWEDDTNVIAIPGENTIAYRQYLTDVVTDLSPGGLPPFGSLLLAIIATNPDGRSSLDTVYNILCKTLKSTDNSVLSNAMSFLKLLADLPKTYKEGKKRILCFQAVFEGCHYGISPKRSRTICAGFKNNPSLITDTVKVNFNPVAFNQDFRTVALLNSKFYDVDDIIRKIASLPGVPAESILLEEAPGGQPATLDLIDALIQNNKTFTTGSLIRHLWGGLSIPFHSSLPSQQPLGGVSDLTNKGDFDKLLISEFAHDDLIFLSRLANNEALYVHREIPPANNSLHRTILIDVSLKNWGTPKCIAFAIMLAIARHPKTDISCSAFVLGEQYHAIEIDSVDSIIDGLQLLSGNLHCAASLSAFLKAHAKEKDTEIFLITEYSTQKQSPLLKVLHEYQDVIRYIIYTDADGHVDVYRKKRNSKQHVQHLKLPLNDLWKKNADANVIQKSPDSHVDYPILFDASGHSKKIVQAPDGTVFQTTSDKLLFRRFASWKGWELMVNNLPFSTEKFEIGINYEGQYIVLLFNVQDRVIVLHNISTKERKVLIFRQWRQTPMPDFIFYGDAFLHYNGSQFWRITIDGKVLEESENFIHFFQQRAAASGDVSKKYTCSTSVLKNITRVLIGIDDSLTLNIHALHINSNKHIKLIARDRQQAKAEAEKVSDSEFIFADGSRVMIERAGMVVLRSSDDRLPTIYVPTALDCSLGVATDEEFAGNEYYYKDYLFDVKLEKPVTDKLQVVKLIKDSAGLTLAEAKEIVDAKDLSYVGRFSKFRAEHIKALLSNKAQVEIQPATDERSSYKPLNRIETDEFFKQYIGAFVKKIQQHGTETKAAS